jgi:dTDP-4-dehydrorhamnose reductase
MLGKIAKYYFSKYYPTDVFHQRYALETRVSFIEQLKKITAGGRWIILNCMGAVPQRGKSSHRYFEINTTAVFDVLGVTNDRVKLIQPSTDCVYSGVSSTGYEVQSFSDASDAYGVSKLLAERICLYSPNAAIVRTSIIGIDDRASGNGFLSWILSHAPGATIPGFTNHYWNGVTTLKWCEFVRTLISGSMINGLHSLRSSSCLTKFHLATEISDVWNLKVDVSPVEAGYAVNRCIVDALDMGDIKSQLVQLRDFS